MSEYHGFTLRSNVERKITPPHNTKGHVQDWVSGSVKQGVEFRGVKCTCRQGKGTRGNAWSECVIARGKGDIADRTSHLKRDREIQDKSLG